MKVETTALTTPLPNQGGELFLGDKECHVTQIDVRR